MASAKSTIPLPPFAGPISRLGAFLIDLVLIYFLGYTLEMVARESLLRLGPFLLLFSGLGAFAYFWLGNGPVGRGATLGKAVLNMRTVDARGKPLGWAASLRRAALQLPTIYVILFRFTDEAFDLPVSVFAPVETLLSAASLTIYLGAGFSLLAHPLRRAWHDCWSGSFVTSDPAPDRFTEEVQASNEVGQIERVQATEKLSQAFTGVIAAILGVAFAISIFDAQTNAQHRLRDGLAAELDAGDYRLVNLRPNLLFYWARTWRANTLDPDVGSDFWPAIKDALALAEEPVSGIFSDQDGATTDSMSPSSVRLGDSQYVVVLEFRRSRGTATLADRETMNLDSMIARAEEIVPRRFVESQAYPEVTEVLGVVIVFGDAFRYVVFSLGGNPSGSPVRYDWVAHGPVGFPDSPMRIEPLRQGPPPKKDEPAAPVTSDGSQP